jgi:predicted ArsR family transcriptional regulator
MEPATRDRILEFLSLSPNSSVEELSRSLNLTRADIRYHLNGFLNAGLVVQMPLASSRTGNPRGRPAKTYQLSAAARADSLADLARVLLSMIHNADPTDHGLQTLADRLFPASGHSGPEPHLSQRLNKVIQSINQRPYKARWEAHAAGPLVFFHNCPFAAIIRQHPELCLVDRLSVENLTSMSARQTKKIDLDGPGSSVCIFKLAQAQ